MTQTAITAKPRLHVTPKGRVYKIDGENVPSVTTILNALPKELKQWAADCAANFAIEHWDELAEQPITKRLDRMRYAHRDIVKAAALRGTEIHDLGELVAKGEKVQVPDEHRGPVEAYARFVDDFDVEPVASEVPVAHTVHRYGGRADLWAWLTTAKLGRHYALIDLKSGGNVYAETTLQLAGYSNADIWQPDGPASEAPMPPVDALYVAHIMPDAVRLLPVERRASDFRLFLYVQQTAAWLKLHGFRGPEPLIGDAIQPPAKELL